MDSFYDKYRGGVEEIGSGRSFDRSVFGPKGCSAQSCATFKNNAIVAPNGIVHDAAHDVAQDQNRSQQSRGSTHNNHGLERPWGK